MSIVSNINIHNITTQIPCSFFFIAFYSVFVFFLMKTQDKNKKEMEIGVLDNASFEMVINYMYSRKVIITSENVANFLVAVDYLGMEREFIF